MLHEPASSGGKDAAAAYKSRLGVWMFVIYALFYIGFVAINIASPLLMEIIVVFGLNLATIYGFALIIGALVLALIYDRLCRKQEVLMNAESENEETKS
ncbi:MAG: DUF485 domain-containing protein [Armatimonadota bacterium]